MKTNLSNTLFEVQKEVIGIYQHFNNGTIELVILSDEYGFTTIVVGDLLGLSTNHYGNETVNRVSLFPDGKSLYEFMENPFEFSTWFSKVTQQGI